MRIYHESRIEENENDDDDYYYEDSSSQQLTHIIKMGEGDQRIYEQRRRKRPAKVGSQKADAMTQYSGLNRGKDPSATQTVYSVKTVKVVHGGVRAPPMNASIYTNSDEQQRWPVTNQSAESGAKITI